MNPKSFINHVLVVFVGLFAAINSFAIFLIVVKQQTSFAQIPTPRETETPGEIQTPQPRETQTPQPRETQTPQPRETQTPQPRETQTPQPRETQTPQPRETQTPQPRETQTPQPRKIQTPKPRETQTPKPRETQTPQPRETQTPQPRETQTPQSRETQTPQPRETQTPKPRETQTPQPRETPTPQPRETQTPQPRETQTPQSTTPPTIKQISFGNIEIGVLGPDDPQEQGKYIDFYQFEGKENQSIKIIFSGSDDNRDSNNLSLNPVEIIVLDSNGNVISRGDNQNIISSMPVKLPSTDTYTIAVTNKNPGDIGRYSYKLSLELE